MRKTAGFTSWRTTVMVLVTVAAGFALTRTVILMADRSSVLKTGGVNNAMRQARGLLAELRDANWDPRGVDQTLLRLPEQDYVDGWVNRIPERPSFMTDQVNPEFDEVAFFCDTFVSRKLQRAKGHEHDLVVTGFFIVGWKDGRVTTVHVADARRYPLPSEDKVGIIVFPGMDEYDVGLRPYAPVTTVAPESGGDGA